MQGSCGTGRTELCSSAADYAPEALAALRGLVQPVRRDAFDETVDISPGSHVPQEWRQRVAATSMSLA